MTFNEPARIFVHLIPGLIPPGALRGGIAVVIDVLRATSVMVHALASGCEAIIPCGEIDEARRVAGGFKPASVLLAGERGGLPIDGFDRGNSPRDFTGEVCQGKTLVMTTTNGTRAILSSLEADRVYIAAFVNLDAVVNEISVQFLKRDHARSIHMVCAGTEGYVSLEDSLLAGALTAKITELLSPEDALADHIGNDEGLLMLSAWRDIEKHLIFRPLTRVLANVRPLSRLLSQGRGGQNVERIGMAQDIDDCCEMNRFNVVGELVRDPLRIVAI
jgi:2-phosphosulfolactate phosphatase